MSPSLILYALVVAPTLNNNPSLQDIYNNATANYKSIKSDENRMKLAQAAFQYGEEIMYDDNLAPMQKYPAALKLFRESTKLNPQDPKPKENIQLIESIYRSLGKEVPN